jgi:predicted peptidase
VKNFYRIVGSLAIFLPGLLFEGTLMGQSTDLSKQVADSFQGSVTKQYAYQYWLYLPHDYDEARPSPLVLFLHGMGERGDDLDLVKVHGPPKLIDGGQAFPFICVSPQCPDDQVWSPAGLAALLDEIEGKYSVDKKRIYVTGLSMGGYGTWTLAAHQPDRFAAIVPICGGASYFDGGLLKDLPIWCFHGGADDVVPLSESERLIALVKRKGNQQAKLTVYEGVGHDSWTETYHNEKVFEWMLSQKLAD